MGGRKSNCLLQLYKPREVGSANLACSKHNGSPLLPVVDDRPRVGDCSWAKLGLKVSCSWSRLELDATLEQGASTWLVLSLL